MDREYEIFRALHLAGVSVPKPIALCTDKSVIGADFYLMEFINGIIHIE